MNPSRPVFPRSESPGGIYLHVPFCLGRCNYCAFVSYPHDRESAARYVECVAHETRLRSTDIPVDTLYFGGGTPSLLPSRDVARLIEECKVHFRVAEQPEITLEINPATATRHALEELRGTGVNRASLGVQSLDDYELAAMGRLHSADDAVETFGNLRDAGFDNVSVDLLAGYPGQTLESIRKTLEKVLDLAPEHISMYLLELKAGTKLHEFTESGKIPTLDDALAADLYEVICGVLGDGGYEHYEISNFAKSGHQSRHNLKYWEDSIYIGLGAGAHGMTGRVRYANLEDLEQYEAAINRGALPAATMTELMPETRFRDALIMGMRLVRGVDLDLLSERYQVDAKAFVLDKIGDLGHANLFVLERELLSLTPGGRLLSNIVFARLV